MNPEVPSTGAAAGEEAKTEKPEEKRLIKGMREQEFKNVVVNLESKKHTWASLNVPKEIENGLATIAYYKPSIIQAVSITHVMAGTGENFCFQAINGSGKTGAFAVPSLMKCDTAIPKIQVIILANTRELIRQIQQVIEVISSQTQVKLLLGDSSLSNFDGQILITSPGYLKNKLAGRKPIDLSALKMIVYDEADELFI